MDGKGRNLKMEGREIAEVKLGQKVRDRLTGFEGTADGRSTFLNGCVQFRVTAKELKDGEPNRQWFDQGDLEVIEAKDAPSAALTGGPAFNPPARSHPDGR